MSWVHQGDARLPETLDVFEEGFPYAPGMVLEIRSHQPPQPFGERGLAPPFNENTRVVDQKILNTRSPSDHVFTKLPKERDPDSQPPEGASSYFAVTDEARLVITRGLAIGDGTGPQVLLCKFDEHIHKPTAYWDMLGLNDRPAQVVAKVFDPLMYFKVKSLTPRVRNDVVDCADVQYAAEAAAYAEFHEAMKKNPMIRDFVPGFYGTWTTIIKNEGWGQSDTRPSDDAANGILYERPVRIILMEYIEGQSIWKICDRRWKGATAVLVPPQIETDRDKGLKRRLYILARILRGLVAMNHIGVLPNRLKATNFIVADAESKGDKRLQVLGKQRVVMVSHGHTEITRLTTGGPCDDQHFPRPRHPAHSHYDPDELNFLVGWFPKEWQEEDDHKTFFEWAQKIFDRNDFTCEEEIKKITDRLDAEWVPPEPKQHVQLLKPALPPKIQEYIDSVKERFGADRDAPSTQNTREAILSDQESASAGDAYSVFDNDYTDQERESSKSTVNRRRSSSQSIRPSGLSSAWTADEATAKEAGKKATESGITTVEEVEGGEAKEGNLADNEVSPKSSSGEERGRERERKRKGE